MDNKSDSVASSDKENSAEVKVIEPTFDHRKDAEEKLKRYISQGAIPKSFRRSMMDLARTNNSVMKLCPGPHIEELQLDTVDSIPSSIDSSKGYAGDEDDYTEEGL